MQGIYITNHVDNDDDEGITVRYAGEDYNFPPNKPVYIEAKTLKGIIGDWEKLSEWDKNIIKGMITSRCPRNEIYAIVGTKGVNLFGSVELPRDVLDTLNSSVKKIVLNVGVTPSRDRYNKTIPDVDRANHYRRGRKKK